MDRWLEIWLKGIALGVLVAGAVGCSGGDGAEQLEGAGLSASRPDAWKPQKPKPQPGDDARRTKQIREYTPTTIQLGNGEFPVVVADAEEKRNDGLAYVEAKDFKDRGMLFMMPAGNPELAVRHLQFDVDVVLISGQRSVQGIGSLSAPGGTVGAGSGARYILLAPKGTVSKFKVARGQSVGMQGGTTAVSGV
ncbi:MAG: DUF192 domain-containing protein [Fimbriimonadaceae bacterium]|nr:DUF192 domain-containing protein [Chthonomonadaceae bacterium]MCO5296020.1 DUF192 domain-containing protein [Fimbriimonadaceae bacterium]